MHNKVVLVTGGAGYIGSHCVKPVNDIKKLFTQLLCGKDI